MMNNSGMATAEFAWTVPADHPAFAGHFPGRPLVPGVVLLDRAILFAERLSAQPISGWQVGNTKFLAPVGPGAELIFTFDAGRSGGLLFRVQTGERAVASGSLVPTP